MSAAGPGRRFSVPADTVAGQRRAADPGRSVWVAANAGSGKTHVLIQRVLRLLLAGVAPESILCLTYTKAAAAEMRGRVARELGIWAILSDGELDGALAALGLSADARLRHRARTLFARALETPGGLKIVTIHAFCESVLHRFPLEAGVPFAFSVIEEGEREEMIATARDGVLAMGLRGEAEAGAVETLFGLLGDDAIAKAIAHALAEGPRLRAVLADPDAARANLRKLVGFAGRNAGTIEADILGASLIGPGEKAAILAASPPRTKTGFETRLAALEPATTTTEDWVGLFLTKAGTVRASLAGRVLPREAPGLAALIEREAERILTLLAERDTARLVARSEALLAVTGAILARYEAAKRARSLLDFDDLIDRLAALLTRAEHRAWVQYKLDAGIHHILVDESQDTNHAQWRVVEPLTEDFFSGRGQIDRPRTVFAVGDPKQSIYSFQGAEPALFIETGRRFAARAHAAGERFERLTLHTSFRTLAGILRAVDLVCDQPHVETALLAEEKVHHDTARIEPGGRVTLWPPVHQPRTEPPDGNWPLGPPDTPEESAPRRLAARIATEIGGWLKAGRTRANGARLRPGDVMVLVQQRSALFHEIIRALRKAGLPTPGADRLAVTGHIAVKDLLALADVLLNPAEDLQLAALLRSPLFDVSEDDLLAIANREARGRASLWQALSDTGNAAGRAAFERLAAWRGRLDFERPFEFFARVLYAEGGLRRFHARLGPEVDDVFAEFLDLALAHERDRQPSLAGFAAALRRREIAIKRDLAESGEGVRVMTVHGAKGLEAPIVILADAATRPAGSQTQKPVLVLADPPGPLLVHASGGDSHVPATRALRDAGQEAQGREYWRKLYVGMTRAEEALYITGALTPGTAPETQLAGTWYEAIDTALRPLCRVETDAEGEETALVFPADAADPETASPGAPETPSPARAGLPPLDLPVLDLPPAPLVLRPSSLGDAVEAGIGALDVKAGLVRGAEAARREGIALHALLQHLGKVPLDARARVLARALPELLPGAEARHSALAEKALSILSRPELGALFGPGSRAELAFLFDARRRGVPVRLAGRIDRLCVDDSEVLVVDYKSDARPPDRPEAVPGPYLTQLGLYAFVAGRLFPGRRVRAGILWTDPESLMIVPREALEAAAEDFTAT